MTWTLFTQLMILGTWLPLWLYVLTIAHRNTKPSEQPPWGDGSTRNTRPTK